MRYLFLLLALPFVLLPNCGGRASSPHGDRTGGEAGADSSSTDSGNSETGGKGSGGKGSSTGGSGSGGKGSSTGGHGEATGGEGGENQTGVRTIEIHFHNDGSDDIYVQLRGNYRPEFGFAHLGEDNYGDPVYVSVGSTETLGDEFGYIECESKNDCSYVEATLNNMPLEIPSDSTRENAAYYRRVSPNETFVLYLHGALQEDIERLQAAEELKVVLGGFWEGDKGWACPESSWGGCECHSDFCAILEQPPDDYYNDDYEPNDIASPAVSYAVDRIEWDGNPIQVYISRRP